MDKVTQAGEGGEDAISMALHQMIPPNVTGQPALTVPCGFSSEGLPIGFQLLGRPFGEATLFRLAHAYEANHTLAAVVPSLR
jgi:aspartyl-tRNA(Asn)/glutamyl-tRNA(Gln) amidotransferase subunit A